MTTAYDYFRVLRWMPKPGEMSKDERRLYRGLTPEEKKECERRMKEGRS